MFAVITLKEIKSKLVRYTGPIGTHILKTSVMNLVDKLLSDGTDFLINPVYHYLSAPSACPI